jgi:diketogulonate reductase-like aldo/keto reductase
MPADSPQLHAARYVGLQIEHSLLERTVERELIPVSKDQQMTVLAWSPLRNGQLTGKYLPENSSSAESKEGGWISEMMKGFGALDESTHAVIREAVAIGKELGVSAAQVALAWLRHRAVPVIPIVGARKLAQWEDNLASLRTTLHGRATPALGQSERGAAWFPSLGVGPRDHHRRHELAYQGVTEPEKSFAQLNAVVAQRGPFSLRTNRRLGSEVPNFNVWPK